MRITLCAIVGVFISNQAAAFEVEGFQSGMSISDVLGKGSKNGFTPLYTTGVGKDGTFVAMEKEDSRQSTEKETLLFMFCKGSLSSLSYNIDIDTEFVPLVENFTRLYGNSARVEIGNRQLNGESTDNIDMYWSDNRNGDKVHITFSPERRNSGKLIQPRTVMASYINKGTCAGIESQ
jgi:hypothetical protein